MARRVFYSFEYKPDHWRAAQVRNMGAIEGNKPATDHDWESIENDDNKIKKWIAEQMDGKSCLVLLIGASTANRKWINYEIVKAWDDGKGVVGIYIHKLLNSSSNPSPKGSNPFDCIGYGNTGKKLSAIVKAYDLPQLTSTDVYANIKTNLAAWVDEAILIRSKN